MELRIAGKTLVVRHITRPGAILTYPGRIGTRRSATGHETNAFDVTEVETRVEYHNQWVARAFSHRWGDALTIDVESNPKVFRRLGLPSRRSAVVKEFHKDHPKQHGRLQFQLALGPAVVLRILRDILGVWREQFGFRPGFIETARATGVSGHGRTPRRTRIPLRGQST